MPMRVAVRRPVFSRIFSLTLPPCAMRFVWLAAAFFALCVTTTPAQAQSPITDHMNITAAAGTSLSASASAVGVLGVVPQTAQRLHSTPLLLVHTATVATSQAPDDEDRMVDSEISPWVVLVLFALFILLVIGGSIMYFNKKEKDAIKRREERDRKMQEESEKTFSEGPDKENLGVDDTELGSPSPDTPVERIKSESSSSTTDKPASPETLMFKAPPKTMKFIPGKLVIISGPDKGREFRIAGFPREEDDGNVVTIGRADVQGQRSFAHIQLGDTYRTVSRIQAEIIQKTKTDKVYLRNKSTTNPTQVNEQQVPPEESVELTNTDTIQMGELVLRYEV